MEETFTYKRDMFGRRFDMAHTQLLEMPTSKDGECVLFNNLSPVFDKQRVILDTSRVPLAQLKSKVPGDKDWAKLCRVLVAVNFSVNFPATLSRQVIHGEVHDTLAYSRELGIGLAAWKIQPGMVEFNCACPQLIGFLQDLAEWGCGVRRCHKGCEFFFYDSSRFQSQEAIDLETRKISTRGF